MILKGIYLCKRESFSFVYGPQEQTEIAQLVDIYAPPQTPENVGENPAVLAEADVIFSTWGMSVPDEAFLLSLKGVRHYVLRTKEQGAFPLPGQA